MSDWPIWIAIGCGGAAGAVLRGLIFHGIESASGGDGAGFWAEYGAARSTLIVNILGSLTLGVLMAGLAGSTLEWSEPTRIFWTTGVCGALTTFGTVCADVVGIARTDRLIHAGGVLATHLVLGISAFVFGLAVAG